MKNFRLIKTLHAQALASLVNEISQHDHLWLVNTARQKLPEQAQTNTISLRAPLRPPNHVGKSWHLQGVMDDLIDCFPVTKDFLYTFAANHHYELARAMIVRLRARGEVLTHKDFGRYYDCRDRFHLVLRSVNGSVLMSGGERMRFNEGELWWFNNSLLHSAFNDSDEWRIHLIFDCAPARLKVAAT